MAKAKRRARFSELLAQAEAKYEQLGALLRDMKAFASDEERAYRSTQPTPRLVYAALNEQTPQTINELAAKAGLTPAQTKAAIYQTKLGEAVNKIRPPGGPMLFTRRPGVDPWKDEPQSAAQTVRDCLREHGPLSTGELCELLANKITSTAQLGFRGAIANCVYQLRQAGEIITSSETKKHRLVVPDDPPAAQPAHRSRRA